MCVRIIGISTILITGEMDNVDCNAYAERMKQLGGVEALESLQNHNNESIQQQASNILDVHFASSQQQKKNKRQRIS